MATNTQPTDNEQTVILARGPWPIECIRAHWRNEHFEPSSAYTEAADAAIKKLQDRGSPSHDGVAARLVNFREDEQAGSLVNHDHDGIPPTPQA